MITGYKPAITNFVSAAGSDTQSYPIPYATIQAASDDVGFGGLVEVESGEYTENIIPTVNNLTVEGVAVQGSYNTKIIGNIVLNSGVERTRLKNLQLSPTNTPSLVVNGGNLGANSYENVYFGAGSGGLSIDFNDNWAGFTVFENCGGNGLVTIGGNPTTGASVTFNNWRGELNLKLNCACTVIIVGTNTILNLQEHTEGVLFVNGIGQVAGLNSTAHLAPKNLMFFYNTTMYNIATLSYITPNKTGAAPLYYKNFDFDRNNGVMQARSSHNQTLDIYGEVSMQGDINFNNNTGIGVKDPVNPTDIANKRYVDNQVTTGGASTIFYGLTNNSTPLKKGNKYQFGTWGAIDTDYRYSDGSNYVWSISSYDANYPPTVIYDGDVSSRWVPAGGSGEWSGNAGVWIAYEFATARKIKGMSLSPRYEAGTDKNSSFHFKKFAPYGSNDLVIITGDVAATGVVSNTETTNLSVGMRVDSYTNYLTSSSYPTDAQGIFTGAYITSIDSATQFTINKTGVSQFGLKMQAGTFYSLVDGSEFASGVSTQYKLTHSTFNANHWIHNYSLHGDTAYKFIILYFNDANNLTAGLSNIELLDFTVDNNFDSSPQILLNDTNESDETARTGDLELNDACFVINKQHAESFIELEVRNLRVALSAIAKDNILKVDVDGVNYDYASRSSSEVESFEIFNESIIIDGLSQGLHTICLSVSNVGVTQPDVKDAGCYTTSDANLKVMEHLK